MTGGGRWISVTRLRDSVARSPFFVALRCFRAASPRRCISALVSSVLAAILQIAFAVSAGLVVGQVPLVADAEGSIPTELIVALGALVGVAFGQFVVGVWRTAEISAVAGHVYIHVQDEVQQALLGDGDLRRLEDPATMDAVAAAEGTYGTPAPIQAVVPFFQIVTARFVGLVAFGLLAVYRWWVPCLLLAAALIWGRWSRRLIDTIWAPIMGASPDLRRTSYYQDLARTLGPAKEVRTFGLGGWIIDRLTGHWQEAMRPLWDSRRSLIRRMVVPGVALVLAEGTAYLVIGLDAAHGTLGLAGLAILVQQVPRIQSLGFLGDDAFLLHGATGAIERLNELAAPVAVPTVAQPRRDATPRDMAFPSHDIVFDDVWFEYPGGDPVLRGVNWRIEAGAPVALVGQNGAGKTTLVKLLCRLYQPTRGRITVDGTDLQDLDLEEWRRHVAVVFQDFVRYPMSARENVIIAAHDTGRAGSPDTERLSRLAGATSVIEDLPAGWQSVLVPGYTDGVDLSGGQWQKMALARALVRAGEHGVLILDEPSANLDVRAEAALFDSFLDVTSGMTSVLISHRLWTCRRADHICFMEGGRVLEHGTHDELVTSGGSYAALFALQAERFKEVL